MKAGEFKVTKDNTKKFLDTMKYLAINEVYVGVPQEDNKRKEDNNDGEAAKINNATIGYINENGSDLANIPPRPHLVPGVRAVKEEISEEFKKSAEKAFTNIAAAMVHLNRAGIIAVRSVKQIITSQEGFEEISARTAAARKGEGFKGTKALIVTGQYRNSITHVIGGKVKGQD